MEEKKKDKKGISLMAGEIIDEIKSIDGFCTKKFHADIITNGIDYKALSEGNELVLDNEHFTFTEEAEKYKGKRIRITRVGKPCFPDCPVPKDQKPCILNHNVAFAEEIPNK